MKRNSLFILMFTFLIVFISLPANEGFAHPHEQERIIVTFKEEIDEELLNNSAMEVHHVFPNYKAAAITVTSEVKKQLQQHHAIRAVEEDSVVTTNAQIIDWGFKEVNAGGTHKLGLTGKGVKVGIVDSGIDASHPDLNIAGGISFVGPSSDYNDVTGHGTHVAGIVAAKDNDFGIVGVAPDAELYAIKVIGSDGLGKHSDVVQGIEWAVQNGLDILNLSITTPEKSIVMELALNNAYERGLLIVGASGNNFKQFTQPVDVLYPARFPTVIAVGAIDKNNKKSSFSYYGNALEFVAPGESIMSTYIPTPANEPYATSSGTSMAAPFVTGIAALYKEAYPMLSNKNIRSLMQEDVIDLGEPGKDALFGYGLIQAPQVIKETIFPDLMPNAWHESAIASLYKEGMISGYPDGRFYPDREITRAEAISIISRTLYIEGTQKSTVFKDVPQEHFASGYIAWANEEGIVSGYPNGNFGPRESVIRADTAVMLASAYNLMKIDTPSFEDMKEEKYYTEAVHILKGLNIASGFPDGTYQPTKKMTRAEFAVLISKALQKNEMSRPHSLGRKK